MLLTHHAECRCHSLDRLAARIWTLLVKGASPRTIVASLRREVGAPVERLEVEVGRVVDRLLAAGLIERRLA